MSTHTHTPAARRFASLAAVLAASASALLIAGAPQSANADTQADKASYVRGTVVNAANGNKLSGVLVTARDIDDLSVIAADTTNANGVFQIDGLTGEEYAIKINGRARSFETGFLACNRTVVPTWGEACSHGTGNLGRARLDRL